MAKYEGVEAFKESAEYADIQKFFTMRKGRENSYADTETYYCKYSRKKMYKICQKKYKALFLSTCDEVRDKYKHLFSLYN